MAASSKCLVNKISENIVAVNNLWDAASIAISLDSVDNASYIVNTLKELPNAACNAGRFVYVKEVCDFRYSDGYNWILNTCTVEGSVNNLNSLWSWGYNSSGGLGDGTTVNKSSPGTVAGGGTTWCSIVKGLKVTAAIKTDGTLWTWGNNTNGTLGNGTTLNRSSPGTVAGGGTTWCQVSAASNTILAIKTDGTLWTWGTGQGGTLGDGIGTPRCSPGTVAGGGNTWCWVSGSRSHYGYVSSAIKTDGTLWTWGSNSGGVNLQGMLGDGTTVNRSSPGTVAGGGTTWFRSAPLRFQTAAIKTDGTLWTWGNNTNGTLGNGTTVCRCSPGTVAGGGTNWCQISGDQDFFVAIKCDGTLWTWGFNSVGLLGDGTAVARCSPGTVAGGGTTWCQVSGGRSSAAAIKNDGTLWTWGSNFCGQLGNGTTVDKCSPGTIAGGGTTWCLTAVGYGSIRSRGF